MHYLVFGASTTRGEGDYQNGGWVTQLRLFIDRQKQSPSHTLTNLSISANTTRDLLNRLKDEAQRRIRNKPKNNFTIILTVGTNDSKIDQDDSQNTISETEFKTNLFKLIKLSQKLAGKVILIGAPPVIESKTTPFKYNHHFTNKRINRYNQITKNLAHKNHLLFINPFSLFQGKNSESLFADGLHPNTQGHKLIFKQVKKSLFQ